MPAFENQRQRAGPESLHQFPGDIGHLLGPVVDRIMAGDMDDQRVIGRAPLGGKNFGDGCRVGGIRPQAVDRFRREGDQLASPQQCYGTAVISGDRDHSP
jgi:hypothetical protein